MYLQDTLIALLSYCHANVFIVLYHSVVNLTYTTSKNPHYSKELIIVNSSTSM